MTFLDRLAELDRRASRYPYFSRLSNLDVPEMREIVDALPLLLAVARAGKACVGSAYGQLRIGLSGGDKVDLAPEMALVTKANLAALHTALAALEAKS